MPSVLAVRMRAEWLRESDSGGLGLVYEVVAERERKKVKKRKERKRKEKKRSQQAALRGMLFCNCVVHGLVGLLVFANSQGQNVCLGCLHTCPSLKIFVIKYISHRQWAVGAIHGESRSHTLKRLASVGRAEKAMC